MSRNAVAFERLSPVTLQQLPFASHTSNKFYKNHFAKVRQKFVQLQLQMYKSNGKSFKAELNWTKNKCLFSTATWRSTFIIRIRSDSYLSIFRTATTSSGIRHHLTLADCAFIVSGTSRLRMLQQPINFQRANFIFLSNQLKL